MKKAILYSAMALATLTMSSCGDDFLIVAPTGSVSESTLTTVNGLDMLLSGAYNILYGTDLPTSGSNLVFGDMLCGDADRGAQAGASGSDLCQFSISSNHSYIKSRWRQSYDGIARANEVLSVLSKTSQTALDEATPHGRGSKATTYAQEIEAMAVFLRAYWHFEVVKVFGAAVPYVSLEDALANTDPQVSNVDESGSYIYIWDKIAEDFKFAYDNLPDYWDSSRQGCVNKWAAGAYLAKLYMYWSSPYNGTNGTGANKWADAKSLFETIMANGCDSYGQKYKLADSYNQLFEVETSDWSGESIFDIQLVKNGSHYYTSSTTGYCYIAPPSAFGNGGWGAYQPSGQLLKSYLVTEDGTPDFNYMSSLDSKGSRYITYMDRVDGNNVIVDNLDIPLDPRVDFVLGRFHVPFMDWGVPEESQLTAWVREYTNGGVLMTQKYHPHKKDGLISSYSSTTSKNVHLFRYADLLLLYAECCIETGDYSNKPFEIINQIRERASKYYKTREDADYGVFTFDNKVDGREYDQAAANYRIGLYKTPFTSKDEAMKALKKERRLELALEGHRFFDLARWGEIGPENQEYIEFESDYLPKYKGLTYDDKWICMPLPFDEINTMEGRLVQNVNWK